MGAAGRLGAARRRPDRFVSGWLNSEEGLAASSFPHLMQVSHAAARRGRASPCPGRFGAPAAGVGAADGLESGVLATLEFRV